MVEKLSISNFDLKWAKSFKKKFFGGVISREDLGPGRVWITKTSFPWQPVGVG